MVLVQVLVPGLLQRAIFAICLALFARPFYLALGMPAFVIVRLSIAEHAEYKMNTFQLVCSARPVTIAGGFWQAPGVCGLISGLAFAGGRNKFLCRRVIDFLLHCIHAIHQLRLRPHDRVLEFSSQTV